MTILLRYLIDYAWIFYIVCAVGAIVYLVRAFVAHRQRSLALFTLEREAATSQIVRAWAMVLVFVLIGAVVFFGASFVLPDLVTSEATPTPATGLAPLTPTPTLTPTPGIVVPTLTPAGEGTSAVPPPPPPATATPTPSATAVPAGVAAAEVRIQFGDFAELFSYSLPSTMVASGQPLQLTLTWQALAGRSQINYVVFTHLRRDDGQIIAQHDGPPAGGTRPTMEWMAGEFITDYHPMGFVADFVGYTGPATIAVGLYDPGAPGERVRTSAGSDYVVLPVTINVVSQ